MVATVLDNFGHRGPAFPGAMDTPLVEPYDPIVCADYWADAAIQKAGPFVGGGVRWGSDHADFWKGWGKNNLQLKCLRFKQVVQMTLPDRQSRLLFTQIAVAVVVP